MKPDFLGSLSLEIGLFAVILMELILLLISGLTKISRTGKMLLPLLQAVCRSKKPHSLRQQLFN